MKLIIDIPDKDYKFIKDLQNLIVGGRGNCKTIQANVINAIRNGTPYNPSGDLISREALKEEFKSRLAACNDWIEQAKDKETKIRASAVKAFIAEVIMTINNAPTVEERPTTCPNCDSGYAQGYSDGYLQGKEERPQGEWIRKVDEAGFVSHICSECGAEIEVEDCSDDKFCFNCGAKMKGGAE